MKRIDPATKLQIQVAAACGVSERRIAEAFNVSRGSVRGLKASEKAARTAAQLKWARKNRGHLREYGRKFRNTPERRASARESSKKWYQDNRDRANAKRSRRSRLERKWPLSSIEKLMIDNYYQDARQRTKDTGIKYEVDHIIPVSKGGPHLPWNLQILTRDSNRSKGAKI